MAAELEERETLSFITCGKALASVGAFVCCGAKLKDYLINRARTFYFQHGDASVYRGTDSRGAQDCARGE